MWMRDDSPKTGHKTSRSQNRSGDERPGPVPGAGSGAEPAAEARAGVIDEDEDEEDADEDDEEDGRVSVSSFRASPLSRYTQIHMYPGPFQIHWIHIYHLGV